MKTFLLAAAIATGVAFAPAAFAQNTLKDGMSKPDEMKSSSGTMMDKKPDAMAKPGDAMARPAGTMDKKDTMSSDKMKK